MSDEDRADDPRGEPEPTQGAGATRWADYLDWLRGEITRAVLALPGTEQRSTRLPSGWTPLQLLSHVLHMEQRWFVWGFLGEDVPDPWGDWGRPEPWTSGDSGELVEARWSVPEDVTAEHLALRLSAVGARTRAILGEYPLGTPGRPGPRFDGEPPTLEWICFHVVTEYARHAGHLDIAVELSAD